jgi:hypothetical protein
MDIEIPKSITYPTGSQGEGYKQIDEFFKQILKEKIKLPINHPHVEKRIMSMWKYMYDNPLPQGAYSFDNAHLLFYNKSIVAAVIETRTDFNDVHFDFFYNQETLENLIKDI